MAEQIKTAPCEHCGGLGRKPRSGCFGPIYDPFAPLCSGCGGSGQRPIPHSESEQLDKTDADSGEGE